MEPVTAALTASAQTIVTSDRKVGRSLCRLAIVGGCSLALYILLALRYPVWPALQSPRGGWSSLIGPSWANTALHLAIYLGVTLLYVAAIRMAVSLGAEEAESPAARRRAYRLIAVVWLACSAVLFTVSPAGESHDVFDYVFRGRMMAEYGGNPLMETPKSFSHAPYYRYIAWHSNVDTYGPVWELSSGGLAVVARTTAQRLGWWDYDLPSCPKNAQSCRLLLVYLTAYRLFAVVLIGLCGRLIVSLVGRRRPRLAPAALAAWLLCPMTLIAGVVGAHNDLLMLAFFFLALWLLQREHLVWALVALILAAHVKLTALIWLPGIGLWIVLRRGWRQAVGVGVVAGLIGLALSQLLYTPFGGWESLPTMLRERSLYLSNSVWSVGYRLLYNQWEWDREYVRLLTVRLPTLLLAVGALLPPLWIFFVRPSRPNRRPTESSGDDSELWTTLLLVSLLTLLLGSFWFQHWYVLWVLAPAVLLPDRRLVMNVLPWLAFGALAANVAVDFAAAKSTAPLPPVALPLLSVTVIWGPALLAGLAFRMLRPAKDLDGSNNGIDSPVASSSSV